jgi:hypothetical protein
VRALILSTSSLASTACSRCCWAPRLPTSLCPRCVPCVRVCCQLGAGATPLSRLSAGVDPFTGARGWHGPVGRADYFCPPRRRAVSRTFCVLRCAARDCCHARLVGFKYRYVSLCLPFSSSLSALFSFLVLAPTSGPCLVCGPWAECVLLLVVVLACSPCFLSSVPSCC